MKKLRKLIVICYLVVITIISAALADLINGGFETGSLNGWIPGHTGNSPGMNQTNTNSMYHYSGNYALWGYAKVIGDSNGYKDDWTRTYVWSGYQDLSNVSSIRLYLTDFQYNSSHYSWGWGQEVYLVLFDGRNMASVCLIDNHEEPFLSLVDRGFYTSSTGNDGRSWYGFNVPVSGEYFSGISNLNLSNARVGILWEAISWHTNPQTLWAGAYIDDIELVYVPEPATICLMAISGLVLLRRKST